MVACGSDIFLKEQQDVGAAAQNDGSNSLADSDEGPAANLKITPDVPLHLYWYAQEAPPKESYTYTITNPTNQDITWSASVTHPWLSLSKSSGTLAAQKSESVILSLAAAAADLATQDYSGSVKFSDAAGATSRALQIKVTNGPFAKWSHGPPRSSDYIPIGVWLQSPGPKGESYCSSSNSTVNEYQQIGINLYINLWQQDSVYPLAERLCDLKRAGMPAVVQHDEIDALKDSPDLDNVLAWSLPDEPDNSNPAKFSPEEIQDMGAEVATKDPTRPSWLNFGQGIAYELWIGSVWSAHPDKADAYADYSKGADWLSFDVYPVTNVHPSVKGDLELVADGMRNLTEWSGAQKPTMNWIETTHLGDPINRPTPHQMEIEVWMSLFTSLEKSAVAGAGGVGYFAHEFVPTLTEAGLLTYPDIKDRVREVNQMIMDLAIPLNAPPEPNAVQVSSSNPEVPITAVVRRFGFDTYLFTVSMRDDKTTATFEIVGIAPESVAEVVGENRTIAVENGTFTDLFDAIGEKHRYQRHIYKIRPAGL